MSVNLVLSATCNSTLSVLVNLALTTTCQQALTGLVNLALTATSPLNTLLQLATQCHGFDEDDVIHLFCTNREVNTENNRQLERLDSKVARIDAENTPAGAKRLPPERFQWVRHITSSVCGLLGLFHFPSVYQCWCTKEIYWFSEGPCLQWTKRGPASSSQLHLGRL